MSIRFKIVKNIVKMMGFKKMFALPKDELLAKAEKSNKGRDFHMPKNKKYRYGDEVILEHYHCLKIGIHEKKTRKHCCSYVAVLLLSARIRVLLKQQLVLGYAVDVMSGSHIIRFALITASQKPMICFMKPIGIW